jgi:hypothetical protein
MYSSGIAVQRGEGLSLTALYSRESQAGMVAPGCVADDRPGGGKECVVFASIWDNHVRITFVFLNSVDIILYFGMHFYAW